ncbi:MAG: magnesium/cobalt transporter CorA [Cytophagaceae bacterium]|nr:magnesium/cobalt transporter CorA [Cytophagaceae bacterium]
MSKFIKRKAREAGLAPGTLTDHNPSNEAAEINVIHYDGENLEERKVINADECSVYKGSLGVTWINVDGVKQVDVIEKIGKCFNLHPLLLEDIACGGHRPKIDDYDDHLFIVINMLSYDDTRKDIISEQVSFVLGENYVLSFQEDIEGDLFTPSRNRLKGNKGKIRKAGADYLMYTLADTIIDNYFIILEKMGERIEEMEVRLTTNPTPALLHSIYNLKREIITLRKSVWPLREVLSRMERDETPLIKDGTKIYIRDVYDHTIQVIDAIESYRDVLGGMLDIYLSSVSNKMNQVMKVLTVISTIFIPLTFIAGVYGMNFRKNFPELDWEYGYPFVWGVMIAVAGAMVLYFRKKKWF